jgi:hypothetical protein
MYTIYTAKTRLSYLQAGKAAGWAKASFVHPITICIQTVLYMIIADGDTILLAEAKCFFPGVYLFL